MKEFDELVYKITSQIPKGKVSTYKAIAIAIGKPNHQRHVGKALARNPRPITIPCHRVVKSDGRLGGFSLGVKRKIELLKSEGIKLDGDKIKDFDKYLFTDFEL
jgi:O-6-methylguanine DNA methyltransferase